MNKREAALSFIRENSKCLNVGRLGPHWHVEYRAVNGLCFFIVDMAKDGWSAFWPTAKNNVDFEMEKFAEISGETFKWPEDEKNIYSPENESNG